MEGGSLMRRLGSAFIIIFIAFTLAYASTTPFNDTFTGTNGTNLQAHTPDTGTSWTQEVINGSGQIQIQSNAIQAQFTASAGGSFQAANATYGSNDYTVTAVFVSIAGTTASRNAWLGCRYANSGGTTGYFAAIVQNATNDVVIYRLDAGTPTKISGSEDTNPTNGDTFALECNGSQIGLKKNGSYVINPITDPTYTTGVAAVGFGEIFGLTAYGTAGGEMTIDTFTVTTIDPSTSVGPLRRRS